MLVKSLIIAAVVAPVVAVSAIAQQSAIKRTVLQTVDFPPGFNVLKSGEFSFLFSRSYVVSLTLANSEEAYRPRGMRNIGSLSTIS